MARMLMKGTKTKNAAAIAKEIELLAEIFRLTTGGISLV